MVYLKPDGWAKTLTCGFGFFAFFSPSFFYFSFSEPVSRMVDIFSHRAEVLPKKEPAAMVVDGAPYIPSGQHTFVFALVIGKRKKVRGKLAVNFLGAFPSDEIAQTYIDDIRKKGYVYFD